MQKINQVKSDTRKNNNFQNTQDRLLSLENVIAIVNIGKTKIYELINTGEFPSPVKIGKCSRWSQIEIDQWLNELFNKKTTGFNN